MKYLRSLIFLGMAASLMINIAAFAQSEDESLYNLLYEGKSLQCNSAANYITVLYQQKDALDQIIAQDEQSENDLTAQIDEDDRALMQARQDLSAAEAEFASDQNNFLNLLAQEAMARADKGAKLNEVTGLQQTIEQYESDINELLEDLAYG